MRRAALAGLALALVAGAALAAPQRFDEALAAARFDTRPATAYFLVEFLIEQGHPEPAEHLRRELWRLQLDRLQGRPMPAPVSVGQAIARGAALPAHGPDFAAAWQGAFNAAVRVSWPGDDPLTLTLTNTGPDPLPPQGLRLRLGSEAFGLTLPCRVDPLAADAFAAARQTLAPEVDVTLVCAAPTDERGRRVLPVLVAAARAGGEPPVLLPRAPAEGGNQAEHFLWARWAPVDLPLSAWQRRWKEAQQPANAGRAWQGGERLQPPELVPQAPSWAERRAAGWKQRRAQLLQTLAFTALTVVLVVLCRAGLRRASAALHALVCGVGAGLVALPVLFGVFGDGQWSGGDGWSRIGTLASGLYIVGMAGAAAFMAMLMLKLYRQLDEESDSWTHTIVDGWRRSLHIGGPTSAGQFWGFVAFAIWAWALISPWGRPWSQLTLAALAVPLLTLGIRRLTSLTPNEMWTLLAIMLAAAANHFA